MVGLIAFQHEVHGQKEDRAQVGQLAGPTADREEQVLREIGRKPLQLAVDTGEIQVRNEGNPMQLIEQLRAARWQLRDQGLHVP